MNPQNKSPTAQSVGSRSQFLSSGPELRMRCIPSPRRVPRGFPVSDRGAPIQSADRMVGEPNAWLSA
jgi:hypothetical protein